MTDSYVPQTFQRTQLKSVFTEDELLQMQEEGWSITLTGSFYWLAGPHMAVDSQIRKILMKMATEGSALHMKALAESVRRRLMFS